jgi:hypothetical protein
MANKKVSDESAASALAGTEVMLGVQSAANVKVSVNQIMTAVLSLLGDTDTTLAANSDLKIATQKAIKTYVDAKAAGLTWKQPVRAKTTGALAANTYANGTSGVGATLTANANGALAAQDGVTLVAADRILVDSESTASHNGIYTVTQVGDGSHPYILTRTTDADAGVELVNASVYVSEGSTKADTQWTCTTNASITVGSTSVAFAQFQSGGTYSFSADTRIFARKTAGAGTGEEVTLSDVLDFIGSAARGDILVRGASAWARLPKGSEGQQLRMASGGNDPEWAYPRLVIAIACSDESTALTAGTNKVKFINPYTTVFNVTGVAASLSTAQTSGSIFTVDINEAGTSILSTKITIDNTETTTSTAATAAVISDASIAAAAEIEVDIDQVGDGTAKGLKIYLIGYPSP